MITIRIRARLAVVEGKSRQAAFVPVSRRGERYDLGGETVELFRIGTLAEALDRDVRTLKEWEKAGLLPRPLFEIIGSTHRRYSAVQVISANRLARVCFRGRRHVAPVEMAPLFAALRTIWFRPGLAVLENGDLDPSALGAPVAP
jgi:hypothetical protein